MTTTAELRTALAQSVTNADLGLNVYAHDTPNPTLPCLIIGRPARFAFHETYGGSRQVVLPARLAVSAVPGEAEALETIESFIGAVVRPLERAGVAVVVNDTGPVEVGQMGDVESFSVVLNLTCSL